MATPATVWTCPECRRDFGKTGQGHMCNPGVTVEEFLDSSPPFVEPVFRRVHDHLVAVDAETPDGALIVDPLEKKVLFKNGPTFCILDVKTKWVAVGFSLRRKLESGRLSRKTTGQGGRWYHVVNVDDAARLDDEFTDWLTEAYHHRSEAPTSTAQASSDPMIPDDIDFEIAPPR